MKNKTLHYSALHGLYWGDMAVIVGFASVYLLYRGFTNSQIGVIMAISNIITVVTSPVLSAFADRTKKISLNNLAAALAVIVTALAGVLYFMPEVLYAIGLVYVLLISVNSVIIPLITSMSFVAASYGYDVNYGIARSVGSVTYAVVVTAIGKFVEKYNASYLPLFCVLLYTLLFLFLFLFRLNRKDLIKSESRINEKSKAGNDNVFAFFKRYPGLLMFLLGYMFIFLHQAMQSTYYFQIMEYKGGGTYELGIASAIAAVMELPTIAGFTYMLKKKSVNFWLRFSAVFYAIKGFAFWLVPNVLGVYAVALMQIATYAIMYTASIYYVEGMVDESDRVKGQGYVITSSTIGGIIASLVGGKILDVASVNEQLMFGALVCFLGSLIVFFSVSEKKKKADSIAA